MYTLTLKITFNFIDFFVRLPIEDTTDTSYAAGDSARHGADISLYFLKCLCPGFACFVDVFFPSTKQDMSRTCVHRRFFASIKTSFADVLLMSTVITKCFAANLRPNGTPKYSPPTSTKDRCQQFQSLHLLQRILGDDAALRHLLKRREHFLRRMSLPRIASFLPETSLPIQLLVRLIHLSYLALGPLLRLMVGMIRLS